MSELLPCPFCGGEAELTGFNAPEYWVWCPTCKASDDAHTGKQNAIDAWNTRAERTLNPCPWCGRDMDRRSEADKDNAGHVWYRDDSDYIQNLIRSNEFLRVKDRTCKLIEMHEHVTMDEPDIAELSCGHDILVFDMKCPDYCPNCGAKVVSE